MIEWVKPNPVGLLAGCLLSFCYHGTRPRTAKIGDSAQIFMNIAQQQTHLLVGKYQVSSLAKPQGEGRFEASVSIRSGKGSATHDRVTRFSHIFDNAGAALHYATEHALGWIQERSAPAHV
jgi:hypothetical protein